MTLSSEKLLLAIDQGTTSSRAIVFDLHGSPVAAAQRPFSQIYPKDGWVEHNPEEIWQTVKDCVQSVLSEIGDVSRVATLGITNQRETTVVWDRNSGDPIGNAIVWQDRRGAGICRDLFASGYADVIQQKTGLIPDSYFSATKLQWILNASPEIRARAERGELAFGTIDTYLLWRLTGGESHKTDATNASRTMLFNIHTQKWDEELLNHFNIPRSLLPDVQDTASDFGITVPALFGCPLPITALVGDQQGALTGQSCFQPGLAKSTFGTGAFVLLNTGEEAALSQNKLLTTIGYRLNNKTAYAVEGSVFNAGTVVQWMRDEMGWLKHAADSDKHARASTNIKVVFVPAFTGLGAPHWDPDARGALYGLTRDTTQADIVRAGLEAVCFQMKDLMDAMHADTGDPLSLLRVDGGMAANDWLLQSLADILDVAIERPTNLEASVWGAAVLAGLGAGVVSSLEELETLRSVERVFEPSISADQRAAKIETWTDAVLRTRSSP
jgi:glycerol kinase